MTQHEVKGACLCGAVTLNAHLDNQNFDACHCSMCRKWGGGPVMTVHAGSNVQFQGQEALGTYRSSDWAERGFCTQCGTHLFYHLIKMNSYFLPLGLLEDTGTFSFSTQIFIDHKPDNYSFANQTEKMTEAEVFAKFAS